MINKETLIKIVAGEQDIQKLELRLRPALGLSSFEQEVQAHDSYTNFSHHGFLGKEESLIETIAEDFETVSSYGTTHLEIANKLSQIIKERKLDNSEFDIVTEIASAGTQNCPWNCNTKYEQACGFIPIYRKSFGEKKAFMALKNLMKGLVQPEEQQNQITFVTQMLPHLISEHYFFEGKKSPYRCNPAFLIEVLGFKY